MFIKTHLLISIFGILIFVKFFNSIESKILFSFVVIIATFIPDIDSRFSKLGKKKFFRPIQFFIGHRGIFHSFTFLLIVFILLFFWKPLVAFGFLTGYGLHIFSDGLTRTGIYPFWPFKTKFKGFIKTGGIFEGFLFIIFLVLDAFLLVLNIYSGAL